MTSNRMDTLLEKAAEKLMNGETLSGDYLRENNVTSLEAVGVTTLIATIVTGFLKAPPPVRAALMLSGVNEDELPDSIIWSSAAQQVNSNELNVVLEKLHNVRI